MRRFVGYIALVFTIIVAVVFNVTLQTSELNTGLEYGTGYEAVYRVDFEESTKSFEDIVDIITQRVEDAGVRNANVEAVSDEMNGEYQIRIKANSESADEFDFDDFEQDFPDRHQENQQHSLFDEHLDRKDQR